MANIFFYSTVNSPIALEYAHNGLKKTWSQNKGEWIAESIDRKFINLVKNRGDIGQYGEKKYTCEFFVEDGHKAAFIQGLKYIGAISMMDEFGVEQSLADVKSRRILRMVDLDAAKTKDILKNKKVTAARIKIGNLYDDTDNIQEIRDLAVSLEINVVNKTLDDLYLELIKVADVYPEKINTFSMDLRTRIEVAIAKAKNYERNGSPMVFIDTQTNRVHFYDNFEKPFGSIDSLIETLMEDKDRANFFFEAIAVEDAKQNSKLSKTATVKNDAVINKKAKESKAEKLTPTETKERFAEILELNKRGEMKDESCIEDLNKICKVYLETNYPSGDLIKAQGYLDDVVSDVFAGDNEKKVRFMSNEVFKGLIEDRKEKKSGKR